MEDPVQFELWGRPREEARAACISLLARHRPGMTTLEATRAVMLAIQQQGTIRITDATGFSEALCASTDQAPSFRDVVVCQQDFSPDASAGYCETHTLYFGGVLGCPVCREDHRR